MKKIQFSLDATIRIKRTVIFPFKIFISQLDFSFSLSSVSKDCQYNSLGLNFRLISRLINCNDQVYPTRMQSSVKNGKCLRVHDCFLGNKVNIRREHNKCLWNWKLRDRERRDWKSK